MSDETETHERPTVEQATPATVVERRVEVPVEQRRGRVGPFVAGFVTAAVLAAIAVIAFLVVSDADDDGNIELDVPAVDVDE